jgi:phosphoglycerate dehydrogenase-like enzyme
VLSSVFDYISAMFVHLNHRFEAQWQDHFHDALNPALQVSYEDDTCHFDDIEVLVGGRPTAEQLKKMPSLKKILLPYVGLPGNTRELLKDFSSIKVHNVHHNATHACEATVGLLLAASQFLIPVDREMRQGSWQSKFDDNPNVMLGGQTAVILGWGAIGQKVAAVLKALGMKIIAVRKHPEKGGEGADSVVGVGDLKKVLPQATALILALPLTTETAGLIGAEELALLPQPSVLVNIARGDIVDEKSLFENLSSGHLRAAAFDVWWRYPKEAERDSFPVSELPFHELDNFIFSPHRAGGFKCGEVEKARVEAVAASLNAYATTGEMPSPVDLQLGY